MKNLTFGDLDFFVEDKNVELGDKNDYDVNEYVNELVGKGWVSYINTTTRKTNGKEYILDNIFLYKNNNLLYFLVQSKKINKNCTIH